MRLKLVIEAAKVETVLLESLDPLKHYIGAMKASGERYVLRRTEWEIGSYSWACVKKFCAGDSLGGRYNCVSEAVTRAMSSPLPMEVFVFTTERELFLWAAGEEAK